MPPLLGGGLWSSSSGAPPTNGGVKREFTVRREVLYWYLVVSPYKAGGGLSVGVGHEAVGDARCRVRPVAGSGGPSQAIRRTRAGSQNGTSVRCDARQRRRHAPGWHRGFSIDFAHVTLSMAAIDLGSAAIVRILAAQCTVPSLTQAGVRAAFECNVLRTIQCCAV